MKLLPCGNTVSPPPPRPRQVRLLPGAVRFRGQDGDGGGGHGVRLQIGGHAQV